MDGYRRILSGEAEESLQNLHCVLLGVHVTVEEAERRNITNQAMLWQLDMLRLLHVQCCEVYKWWLRWQEDTTCSIL
jgi:hypothetical protein